MALEAETRAQQTLLRCRDLLGPSEVVPAAEQEQVEEVSNEQVGRSNITSIINNIYIYV